MKNFSKIIEYLFYLFVLLLPLQTRWIWHYGKLGDGQSQYLTYSLYGTEILLALILILALIYINLCSILRSIEKVEFFFVRKSIKDRKFL